MSQVQMEKCHSMTEVASVVLGGERMALVKFDSPLNISTLTFISYFSLHIKCQYVLETF